MDLDIRYEVPALYARSSLLPFGVPLGRIAGLNRVTASVAWACCSARIGRAADAIGDFGVIDAGGEGIRVVAMNELLIAVGLVHESIGRRGINPASPLRGTVKRDLALIINSCRWRMGRVGGPYIRCRIISDRNL